MLILEDHVSLETPSGPMRVHTFRPKDDARRYPGLILYSEIFQITGPIRRIAARLAAFGLVVYAPEVYHESLPPGTVLAYTPEDTQRGNDLKAAKETSAFDADTAACVAHLQASPHCTGKVGASGLCLGGGLALRAALHPNVSATVTWYATDVHKRTLGKVGGDDTIDRFAEVRGELMCIWGRQDPHINQEGRRALYDALSAAGTRLTWLEFNGAHAFMRDEGSGGRYDAALAHTCIGLAADFLRSALA
jgi:carboxymethylenebutenolidase